MPNRLTQTERRNASREALVRSAMHAFNDRGYSLTTVADIVDGTGYSAGAFYHHFANKADCLWHVVGLRERLREGWIEVAVGFDPATTSLQALITRVFARLAEAHEGTDAWTLVMADAAREHRGDVAFEERMAAVHQGWIDELAAFVDVLRDRGYIGTERDSNEIAVSLYAFGEGLAVHARLYSFEGGPEAYARALLDGVVRLLR